MKLSAVSRALTAIALVAAAQPALAQTTPSPSSSDDWRQTIFLYGMGVSIDGDATVGNLTVPVDMSISDVFDNLKVGFMGAYRIENEQWSINVDTTFMNLGNTERAPRNNVRAYLDVEQWTLMGTVGRRFTDHLEGLFSLAYFDVAADLELRVLQQRARASRSASWVDPLVGLNYKVPLGEKWSYGLRGDVGGFGVGSDLTWHLLTGFQHRNTDSFSWYVGYRVIAYDYENGSGVNYQRYDMTQQGPLAGVAFHF
jgi:hypothetical protein